MSRTVILVALDGGGRVLGALPPYEVATPWWMEAADIVAGARRHFGVGVTVLRLLHADRPRHPGGTVHYAVQLDRPYGHLQPVSGAIRTRAEGDDPKRAAYARPGGPQETLAWARSTLDELGLGPMVATHQERTWNLSAIWRLTTPTGTYWLKQVPPFFAHEPTVLGWLGATGHGRRAPTLLAADGPRILLAHVDGEMLYDAETGLRCAIATDMHEIQASARVGDLLALGIPDRRDLTDRLTAVAHTHGDPGDARLRRLVDDLPHRLARLEACGLPHTLVHGDLHGGNVAGTAGGDRVILDWGDCVVGHPAIDILRLVDSLPAAEATAVLATWDRLWQETVPGCDPVAAVELMRPVHDLYYASVYAGFLDHIEATEEPYHRNDVPECLARAAAQVSGAGGSATSS